MTDEPARYARLHAILDGARTRHGAALETYLARACAGDEALRAEVLALLEAGLDPAADDPLADHNLEGARRALEDLLAGADSNEDPHAPAPEARPPAPDWAGFTSEILGRLATRGPGHARYALRGKVASGGQGVVLRVWDEDLQRHLAMKVMLDQDAPHGRGETPATNPKSLGRFLEEAQITGQLEHPGIVPVHELGLDAQGRVYFTMRLVEGETLTSVLQKTRTGEDGWTQTRTLGVLLRVCEAMAFAHEKGVIHRDLKPSNVMVGRFGQVFVMDWGLARILGQDERRDLRFAPAGTRAPRSRRRAASDTGTSPLVTMDGDVLGTPQYMPPEQARGLIEAMGAHSDVYSVGAMLYELLAGHPPFLQPGSGASAHRVIARVQSGPPEPLERRASRAAPELIAICQKAMARAPRARYPDMAALSEDLSAFLENRVVAAHATGAGAELRKWIVRNRALSAALGTVLLTLVTGLVVALYLKNQSDRNATLASERGDALQQVNAHLEERTREAESRRDEVLQLAALQDLEDLLAAADALWPARADRIGEYTAWIEKAQALVADLPGHRARRAALRSTALPRTAAEIRAGEWHFPEEDAEPRWWNNQLTKLIEGLAALESELLSVDGISVSAEHGWSVPRRRAFAERLRSGFEPGGELALLWEEALPAVHRAYPGLALRPQIGLVPLGPDPVSRLWEFGDLSTGRLPARDGDGRLVLSEDSALVFVLVPGGTFTMGAQAQDPAGANHDSRAQANEGPAHEVTVSAFFISKYEMTQAQWAHFAGPNPSVYRPPSERVHSLRHPVETVDWHTCMKVCGRLGISLPSEAQWEYAARAGTSSAWWTGDEATSLHALHAANVADRSAQEGTAWMVVFEDWDDGSVFHSPVGSYAPNPFGLYDVHGNVWEWCLDGFSADFYGEDHGPDPVNAPGPSSRIVYRGGAFNAPAGSARSAYRDFDAPSLAHNSTGLRPARSVIP